ncbi:FAD/NAD(P)-binding protein [Falsirhodobacter sp. 20TX0035]|uniref:FAD/NAD(P)-binding protein n=1 Tax=Falsirhodobacter sp. 20TX0035 TaxID=3022019 RepID=UPI00232E91B0|nr:FAD/NAD(P)-binding protein [Falsirhodobacter sp. 20TX0035]MDB6453049.1 FAD/NAD(P)-binding protein [Falsirhodobacter sp. 20TX0035]
MTKTQNDAHDLVIGGGATGVIMAAQILSRSGRRVTLVGRDAAFGHGIAYSTRDADHLLNTRVASMSAYSDRPDDFMDWLAANGLPARPDGFVSRATYGRYMQDLLRPWRNDPRLTLVQGEVVRLRPGAAGVTATLDDGRAVDADRALLATGHALAAEEAGLDNAWRFDGAAATDGRVVIIGTGLSMVDQTLSLLNGRHRGPIVAVSRRGLLPLPHDEGVPEVHAIHPPVGGPVSQLLHWVRRHAREAEAAGGTWRDTVDSLRPHAQALWQAMSQDQRRRFLRHAASWWGIHRHRIPPGSGARIRAAMDSGQLEIRRGTFRRAEPGVAHLRAPDGTETRLDAARIIDCRGILRDPATHGSPLVRDLLEQGVARMDPLRIGLDVTPAGHLIGRDGQPQPRLLAVGPVARAALWEVTAIPDIREQAVQLAIPDPAVPAVAG